MEESTRQLWVFCMWYAGISTTVVVGLFGWLISLSNRIAVKENIHVDINTMKKDLNEIKVYLIGDFEKKGLVTKYHELEDRVQALEKRE